MTLQATRLCLLITIVLGGFLGTSAVAEECVYAVSDNGEFSIEFLDYEYDPKTNQVTIFYEVCKLKGMDLSHWSIDLLPFHFCLKAGCTAEDFIPSCQQTAPFDAGGECGDFHDADCEIGVDPNTGIPGLKWDNLKLGDGKCQCFAFTLDLDCIRSGHHAVGDCVQVAFKAGNQDIRDDGDLPGFAHVFGPTCKAK